MFDYVNNSWLKAVLFNKNQFVRKNVDRYELTHNEKVYIIHLGRSKCSCRKWLKYKVCKHLLAADRIFSAKLVKDQFINKPKRGRTPNALRALSKK